MKFIHRNILIIQMIILFIKEIIKFIYFFQKNINEYLINFNKK